jgi:asparagine synthase (glutamine-hydrolysing)
VLARAVYYADEPFADTSMIPTYLLAEFARQDVTVCLTGDGGDELFGGYETYAADQAHHLLRWLPAWTARSMRRAVERLWPATRDKVGLDYKIRKFLEGLPHAPGRAHYHWRTIFSDQEKLRLLREPLSTEANQDDAALHFDAFRSDVADCHYLDQAMYVDVKTWLVDDILVKVDRTTMAHGLEARAPLLDYRLVEFAASLPVEMKIRALRRKYLLKESQRGRLPDGVIDRRKAGFNSPLSHWLTTSLRSRIIDLAARADGELRRVFDSRYIDMLWHEHESGAADHSLKLFGLINLLLWADQFDARWP